MSADTIFVQVLRTPDQERTRPAGERVLAQRAAARRALDLVAARAGCPDRVFQKTAERGPPIPTESGWHWTITHDATYVAAAVDRTAPLGVDVERNELRRRVLVERVADERERALLGERDGGSLDGASFARLWTGKEAVLKAERIGIPGLSKCRVVDAPDEPRTELEYDGAPRHVSFIRAANHTVSLCSLAPGERQVVWLIEP